MHRPLLAALLLFPAALAAQTWNDARTTALVERAVERRAADPARGLRDFRARAHGFVFFLAQLGEEQLREPPRLVKSDQLELEVYWKAPGASKQRIVGWRDRVDLPTDIQYHRDHLGIVQNGFADRIRLGEGQEVRDVPHPLAADGRPQYDFALVDSTIIRLPQRTVRVHEVQFRPRSAAAPGIVGRLFLDADGGELVRMRFNFTRAAYRDPSLEDITIVLENGLWEGRFWLPRRQEIEIRRRTTWLELPARGIIRGRWDIDGYAFDVGLADSVFFGPEIVAAPDAERDGFVWDEPLDRAVARAGGAATARDLEQVREEVRRLAAARVLTGLQPARPAVGSLSDLLHVNRVEGLAPGLGFVARPAGGLITSGWAGIGFADERVKARATVAFQTGPHRVGVSASREIEDIGAEPVIAPLINSLLAQELGIDYGDYVLAERLTGFYALTPGPGLTVSLRAGPEWSTSVAVAARPAAGTYRANPALGAGRLGRAEFRITGSWGTTAAERRVHVDGALEGGARAGPDYVRGRAALDVVRRTGPVTLAGRAWAGWGSEALPLHRQFVLGGRGTLVGTPYRAWGGRRAAWGRLELQVPVPAPAVPLGPFASTGRQAILAPYVAAGWADAAVPGSPWTASAGLRPVLGVRVEWFHRLLWTEFGWSPRDGGVGLTVDLQRSLWPIL